MINCTHTQKAKRFYNGFVRTIGSAGLQNTTTHGLV